MKMYISMACLCLAGTVCLLNNAHAQDIPLNTAVTVGKLPNGFTYYIRKNSTPPGRVTMYLANKVGSILETDSQQGLAHFMEHMSFNGTTHFPKNQLIEYLQKSGVRFGADLNAYTSFDETVYQLPLPTDDPALLKNGLQILRDWAQEATLDSVEIEKERGVVLEEKRLNLGVQERMQQKTFPVQLNHSRYAQRVPIGTEQVITTFNHRQLIDFYKDWYRPDLQALIVVGDIDVRKIESDIKTLFSDLKMPRVVKPRIKYDVPLTGANQYLVVSDPEFPYTVVEITYKFKQNELKTVKDYEEMLLTTVFNQLAADRFAELMQRANAPVLQAGVSASPVLGGLGQLAVQTVAKPGELEKGFKAVWQLVESMRRLGFTAEELTRAKTGILSAYQARVGEEASIESAALAAEYARHFTNGEASPGIVGEYKYAQAYFTRLTLGELNAWLPGHISAVNRDIIIMVPEADKSNTPAEPEVERWMRSVEGVELKENVTAVELNESLMSSFSTRGKVVNKKNIATVGVTELTLSNGAKVILKPTPFKKEEVLIHATSAGGTSLYSDADYESAASAAGIVSASGIGKFPMLTLQKMLTGKQAAINPYIAEHAEGMIGGSRTADLETALQLMHLYFTAPRTDTTVFNNVIEQSAIALQNRYAIPENVFSDSAAAILGDYQWRKTGPSPSKLKQIELNKVSRIYRERFSNAADFTFTFVGDFTVSGIKPLLEKYIGSLPFQSTREKAKALPTHRKPGKIKKTVYAGHEPKAQATLVFRGDYVYTEKNNMLLEALRDLLSFKLTERLRENEGGVYSPRISVHYAKKPQANYALTVSFGCSPANATQLIQSTLEEVNALKVHNASDLEMQKIIAEETRQLELQLTSNNFWLSYLVTQHENEDSITQVLTYRDHLKQLTPEDVKAAARVYLEEPRSVQIIYMPVLHEQ
jgi:zinc protease